MKLIREKVQEVIIQILKKKSFYAVLLAIYAVSSARSINRDHHTELLSEFYGVDYNDSLTRIDSLIAYAKEQLEKPYAYGAKGPDRFDCSGYTGYVFRNFDIRLSASAHYQSKQGVEVGKDELKPGDLVFFRGPGSTTDRVGHVGIVLEVSDGSVTFIHSSTNRGVVINDLIKSDHYRNRYLVARRIL
ncbi:C40 family peptidase [Marinoscillum pacificum]|uniref:C40 family peptidase n=1 Tax=Marinoscillum pacificum TaxID=392723 RepID=UPI0021584FDB|nr:C40 family peptidase [Marinoscillum pacificum]